MIFKETTEINTTIMKDLKDACLVIPIISFILSDLAGDRWVLNNDRLS